MNILLADDEPLARQRLRRLLTELAGNYQIVAEAADGNAVLTQCGMQPVDVVLLDVRMPGMDGLQVAAQLGQLTPPPAIILVTAYPDYALAAFEHHVSDYLVKPVRRERLQAALARLHVTTRLQLPPVIETGASADMTPARTQLCSHYRGGLYQLPVAAIIYLRAEQKYVVARHPAGRVLLNESLKQLEQEFAGQFVRIHRSILIAPRALVGIEHHCMANPVAVLTGVPEQLPISRRHVAAVRQLVRGH